MQALSSFLRPLRNNTTLILAGVSAGYCGWRLMKWLLVKEDHLSTLEVHEDYRTLRYNNVEVAVEGFRVDSTVMPVMTGSVDVENLDQVPDRLPHGRHPRGHICWHVANIVIAKMYNGYCVPDNAANRMVAAEMCREEFTRAGVRHCDMSRMLARCIEMVFTPTEEMQVASAYRASRYRRHASQTILDDTLGYIESAPQAFSRSVIRPFMVMLFGRRRRLLELPEARE